MIDDHVAGDLIAPGYELFCVAQFAEPRRIRTKTVCTTSSRCCSRLANSRAGRARDDGVPAYVVFPDTTLAAIAEHRPRDWADLAGINGVGPAKLERYADDVLTIVANS